MTSTEIVAVVLTLNEEEHLEACLTSLEGLASRTLILDSGSTDRTVDIARGLGAVVIHSPFTGYASQRNRALDLAGDAEWVLFLDADERLTEASRAEIQQCVCSAGDDLAGFWLPRRNVAFGRALRGGGWWPDYQARLIRLGRGRYDASREVHEVVLFDGRSEQLHEPFIHLNYSSRSEFMRKQHAYTLRYVQQAPVETPRMRGYLGRPVREFWRRFVVLKGYRDRGDGLFMAAVMAMEEFRACRMLRRRKTA